MKHDRNHRRKCGPSYTPMMITRHPQKKHGLHIHGVSFLVFLFFPPLFFSFFPPPWKITNNENVRAYSTKIETVAESVTKHSFQRIVMNETFVLCFFFLFNLSLSFLFFFLILYSIRGVNFRGIVAKYSEHNVCVQNMGFIRILSNQSNNL